MRALSKAAHLLCALLCNSSGLVGFAALPRNALELMQLLLPRAHAGVRITNGRTPV